MSKMTFKMAMVAAATSGLLIAAPVFADAATGPGFALGPGMMGGGEQECDMGPGLSGGHGHGHGMGSGMMGGSGPGYGMGPGMMGGYGQGYGMSPGMMGFGGAPGLNLSDEQRANAGKIRDASRKRMWTSMGGMLDASSKLRELLSAATRDRAAISAAYKQVGELRQQMFEIGLDAREEFERLLSADQRKQLRR